MLKLPFLQRREAERESSTSTCLHLSSACLRRAESSRPSSLEGNEEIGNEGAVALSEALQSNATLTELRKVAHALLCACSALSCREHP